MMKPFDVYPLFPITPVKASGSVLWDEKGKKYLDLYGGHAVISIGHSHPAYVEALKAQLNKIGFYSNSVINPLQDRLAERLGAVSGYENYQLFLCNSGAEAIENAIKVASFGTGKKKVIAFSKSFHGRTSGAVAITDDAKIIAPFNACHEVVIVPLNDEAAFLEAFDDQTAAVIIEGIQGLGGIHLPSNSFLQLLERTCRAKGAMLILDEIQSGYGRTGNFFAHQVAGIKPDLTTIAKGMGNGFPVGGVLIHPDIKPWSGMLGTTFGGNYLACVAALTVLDVIESENLIERAHHLGSKVIGELKQIPSLVDVRGRGLMIGIDLPEGKESVRKDLLFKHGIFTGTAKPNTIRLLPALTATEDELDFFVNALKQEMA